MNKPIKPSKKMNISHWASFHFEYVNRGKVSLQYFLNWVKETVPAKAIDPTIKMEEDFDTEGNIINCYLSLNWEESVKNKYYESEMKKYQKKLIKWKKENAQR